MKAMKEMIRPVGFVLLIIGTAGLLINEFALNWGSIATVTFAIINLVGLIILALAHWKLKK